MSLAVVVMEVPAPGKTIAIAEGMHVDASSLLESLESSFGDGVRLDTLAINGEPLTPELWTTSLLSNSNPEVQGYQLLYSKWSRAHEQHLESRKSLLESKDLFSRLLCFLSDLREYDKCKAAEERMNCLVPTVPTLFDSPVYFGKQEKQVLECLKTPTGHTVSEAVQDKFGDRPYFQNVCTSHVLAPFLMGLFSITDECLTSKEFNGFRKGFNIRARDQKTAADQKRDDKAPPKKNLKNDPPKKNLKNRENSKKGGKNKHHK